MQLSKYVVSVIRQLNFDDITQNYKIAEIFENAEKTAPSSADADILKIVGGSLTMWYSPAEDTYCPMIAWNNGTSTFSLENIDE